MNFKISAFFRITNIKFCINSVVHPDDGTEDVRNM